VTEQSKEVRFVFLFLDPFGVTLGERREAVVLEDVGEFGGLTEGEEVV